MSIKKIQSAIFLAAFAFCLTAMVQNNLKVELANEMLNKFLNVRDFCISANQDEIYFSVQSPS